MTVHDDKTPCGEDRDLQAQAAQADASHTCEAQANASQTCAKEADVTAHNQEALPLYTPRVNKTDVLSLISPEMKAVLEQEASLAGDANDTSCGFEQMRENYVLGRAYWVEGGPQMEKCVDARIHTSVRETPVRFYYPTAPSKDLNPAIVYIHGGGFVLGNLETHDRICRVLADEAQLPVMAIDYGLSPEHRFPQAVIEISEVIEHVHLNGSLYGIDGDYLACAGDSGGAYFSMASSLYLRNEMGYTGKHPVKACLLYYGWYGLADSVSMKLFGGEWDGLTEKDWEFYTSLYATGGVQELLQSPYGNLFLNDLSQYMPATYFVSAEFDPLRDDSVALHQMLKEKGHRSKYDCAEGTIHAFLHYTKMLSAARTALARGAEFYRAELTELGRL